jgi:FixJ family two-component response regulator
LGTFQHLLDKQEDMNMAFLKNSIVFFIEKPFDTKELIVLCKQLISSDVSAGFLQTKVGCFKP